MYFTSISSFVATVFETSFGETFSPGGFTATTLPNTQSHASQQSSSSSSLFQCTNEGCVRTFMSLSSLERHLAYGECEVRDTRATMLDMAKIRYTHRLQEGASTALTRPGHQQDPAAHQLEMGWALKSTKKTKRFSKRQKKYLDDMFSIGQQTGNKADASAVARNMRYAKNSDGGRLFNPEEFLTPQQITSYFSRKALKNRQRQSVDSDDEEAALEEHTYASTRTLVIREVALQHPIAYDHFNLCDMMVEGKLKQLSVVMLRQVCEQLDIHIPPSTRRKALFIDLLSDVLKKCTCHSS
ncbi:uncharacterized protein LOC125572199 [Nematostella vectensis]|uniref:uncharacterized protein LOC125572199 n=1 Tax=Nematostella vectensis TaxID=45351 RepID=UPI0020778CB1|nr:uncharacterized protein LOC125572199 [Nematostella vectensis]